MAVSAAYAHAPTAVTLTPTETTILISWTHSGDADETPDADADRLKVCTRGVDGTTATTHQAGAKVILIENLH